MDNHVKAPSRRSLPPAYFLAGGDSVAVIQIKSFHGFLWDCDGDLILSPQRDATFTKQELENGPSDIMAAMLTSKKIAIIADTHVGDRVQQLEPTLLSALQNEKLDQILHAGDVSTPEVIEQLEVIAPTLAVQGNRDWFLGYKLPKEVEFEVNGVKIALTHGHFSIWHWFWDYVRLFISRKIKDHTFFQKKLVKNYPEADIIVFGHLHFPYDEVKFGKRFLNPGAGYPEWRNNNRPGYIILTVETDGSYATMLKFTNPQPQKTTDQS